MADFGPAVMGALIGSGVGSFATYHFQNVLASRRRREAETRVAFVRMVEVTEILALEETARIYIGNYIKLVDPDGAIMAKLRPADGAFEPTHAIAVLIEKWCAEGMPKVQDPSLLQIYKSPAMLQMLEPLDFKLTTSELADLPPDSVALMMAFSKDSRHLRVTLGYIFERIAALDAKAFSADFVFDVLQLITSALQKAKAVRQILVLKGRISPSDAAKAHQDAMDRALSTLVSSVNKKKKNQAARDSMDAEELRSAQLKPN